MDGIDTVYPVNALAFHPTYVRMSCFSFRLIDVIRACRHGTFATGGGDGIVSIWDLAAKKRLRQYTKYPSSITSLSFNCDGTRLAVAGSIFLEEGTPGKDRQNGIWIKSGMVEDCKVSLYFPLSRVICSKVVPAKSQGLMAYALYLRLLLTLSMSARSTASRLFRSYFFHASIRRSER